MNQIVYNITYAISAEVRDQWLQWMREVQMPRVLQTGLFLSARLMRVHAFEKDALTYSVQYLAESSAKYEEFHQKHASVIEGAQKSNFGDAITPFATILEVLDSTTFAPH